MSRLTPTDEVMRKKHLALIVSLISLVMTIDLEYGIFLILGQKIFSDEATLALIMTYTLY
jgi:hypothetical protein